MVNKRLVNAIGVPTAGRRVLVLAISVAWTCVCPTYVEAVARPANVEGHVGLTQDITMAYVVSLFRRRHFLKPGNDSKSFQVGQQA